VRAAVPRDALKVIQPFHEHSKKNKTEQTKKERSAKKKKKKNNTLQLHTTGFSDT
jgi:hypothetical protein